MVREHHPEGLLVAIDFAKAFDSVRWSFIFQVLQAFNFGESFIEYVQLIFVDIQSCLYNSKFTSAPFSPGRGVRQGCCVSPSIFLLAAEILAILIRENGNIKGIRSHDSELKLAQFADDTTCFLADQDSLRELLSTMSTFASWSGLSINKSKTKIISPHLLNEGIGTVDGMPVVDRTKILGIWVGIDNTEANTYTWNFKNQLEKISSICDSWSQRMLSLKGKVTVVNSLLISLLQYPCSVTFTPERVAREYRRLVSHFLWDGKKPKIAYSSLIQPIERGGLKLMDLEIRIKVNLLQWARRVIKDPMMNAARATSYVLESANIKNSLRCRKTKLQSCVGKFRFYFEMLKVWRVCRDFEPQTEDAIRKEPLWFNNYLTPGLHSAQQQRWREQGIEVIDDVCHQSCNRLLSHTEITEKFNVPCSFLESLSLRLSVPLRWRQALTNDWRPDPGGTGILLCLDGCDPEDISILSPKRMYSKLLTLNRQPNTALKRWMEGDDGLRIADQSEWSAICSNVFQSTRETKLQSFQYKVLNRIIPCKVFLKRIRIADSDTCPFCRGRDSVAHFLFSCDIVRPFWQGVCSWFNRADELYLDKITPKEYVFGLPKESHRSDVINPILAHCRYFIHRQKLFHDGNLDLTQWLREFRVKLRVEQWICTKLGKMKQFCRWRRILQELG